MFQCLINCLTMDNGTEENGCHIKINERLSLFQVWNYRDECMVAYIFDFSQMRITQQITEELNLIQKPLEVLMVMKDKIVMYCYDHEIQLLDCVLYYQIQDDSIRFLHRLNINTTIVPFQLHAKNMFALYYRTEGILQTFKCQDTMMQSSAIYGQPQVFNAPDLNQVVKLKNRKNCYLFMQKDFTSREPDCIIKLKFGQNGMTYKKLKSFVSTNWACFNLLKDEFLYDASSHFRLGNRLQYCFIFNHKKKSIRKTYFLKQEPRQPWLIKAWKNKMKEYIVIADAQWSFYLQNIHNDETLKFGDLNSDNGIMRQIQDDLYDKFIENNLQYMQVNQLIVLSGNAFNGNVELYPNDDEGEYSSLKLVMLNSANSSLEMKLSLKPYI